MAYAHIFSPSKSAMQSGKAKTGYWILEYCNSDDKFYDPIMGWTGSLSTEHQVSLKFDTLEEAIEFARNIGLDPVIDPVQNNSIPQKKSYADNFRYHKPQ